ncbi:MAG: LysR family transcriptional regulator [Pseudopelagicola sp.]|nr:LysR family transcriptional regulator [Pseudopelagicola sp.]
MLSKGVTLRGLEVFEALAQSGSVAQAADETGLSQPAVSQQIRNLETALGTALVDHGKRPMRLTAAGRGFLVRTNRLLSELRLAQSELTVMDLSHLTSLSLGIIDDFDNDLTPRLATVLAESLTNCRFRLITAPSHEINTAMKDRSLHLGVAASTGEMLPGVTEYPLVHDPFIIVAPRGTVSGAMPSLDDLSAMPFLRYERTQLISRMIDAHFARLTLNIPERFEIGSHLALMAMIAQGIGWSVTTPLGYMRAVRFHDKVEAYPLPFAPFRRTISLFASTDWADRVPRDVHETLRRLLQEQIITPSLIKLPWLAGDLRLTET